MSFLDNLYRGVERTIKALSQKRQQFNQNFNPQSHRQQRLNPTLTKTSTQKSRYILEKEKSIWNLHKQMPILADARKVKKMKW